MVGAIADALTEVHQSSQEGLSEVRVLRRAEVSFRENVEGPVQQLTMPL